MKPYFFLLIISFLFLPSACSPNQGMQKTTVEEPQQSISFESYSWPESQRSYWPTEVWRSAPMQAHGIDSLKIHIADSLAETDDAFRSLLVIKDGLLVFEKYYNDSGPDKSTEVWSVTKSFISALVGIAIEQGHIEGIDQRMAHYLPDYPGFKDITIRDVLTHQTGLNWDEADQQAWIQSADWVENGLDRGFDTLPGTTFLYSSANSHFLSKLLQQTTGMNVGVFADKTLFSPIGIDFSPSNRKTLYSDWQELHVPIPHSWRQDNSGLEIGAFGLHLTAREMAKFGFLYLNKGKWAGKTVIPENWIETSTKEHVSINEHKGFGLHWVTSTRNGHHCFEADGWGGQMISVIPALDMIVVIKCDEIRPRDNYSYKVLQLAIEAAQAEER